LDENKRGSIQRIAAQVEVFNVNIMGFSLEHTNPCPAVAAVLTQVLDC